MVKNSPPLDLNSLYYYLIFCSHFKETSIIAKDKKNQEILGFISAYLKPNQKNTLFVWQVVVNKKERGKKLGLRLLTQLVLRDHLKDEINYLETTVTPSNKASEGLFESFSKFFRTSCNKEELFSKKLFGNLGHEAEILFRIGPFNNK